jgi:hypothetical protein
VRAYVYSSRKCNTKSVAVLRVITSNFDKFVESDLSKETCILHGVGLCIWLLYTFYIKNFPFCIYTDYRFIIYLKTLFQRDRPCIGGKWYGF